MAGALRAKIDGGLFVVRADDRPRAIDHPLDAKHGIGIEQERGRDRLDG